MRDSTITGSGRLVNQRSIGDIRNGIPANGMRGGRPSRAYEPLALSDADNSPEPGTMARLGER
jgi:hypothetical protein